VNKLFLSLTLVSCLALGVCVSPTPTNSSVVHSATPTELPQATSNSAVRAQTSQVGLESLKQTSFGAEQEMQQPVSIPQDVLEILRHDEGIQRNARVGESQSDISASWFVASEINLNDDQVPELIVQSANPRLFGANLVPFWIFRKTLKGNELTLRVDALKLELLKTKRKGYRNIRTTKATANEVISSYYEFDGNKYEKRHSSREPIKH